MNTEFDGWGYTHLFENSAGEMRRVDSFAIEEARPALLVRFR